MAVDFTLREMVRQAVQAGRLPSCSPVSTRGGGGSGSCFCTICGERIAPTEAEFELEFARGVASNSRENHHLHLRCFAAWDFERHGTSDAGIDPTPGTLGAVLYANQRSARLHEKEWVFLVQAVAAGNQLALHALYDRAHRAVFTLIFRLTSNRETAEELTLDIFHDVWRRAASYDAAGGTVLGWIMNQARSRAIDRLRFEQRKKRVHPNGENPLAEVVARESEEAVLLREQRRQLKDALSVLSPDERQAVETAYFSELTHAEVAVRLNLPLGTVKTRIRSALSKLRQVLADGVKDS